MLHLGGRTASTTMTRPKGDCQALLLLVVVQDNLLAAFFVTTS